MYEDVEGIVKKINSSKKYKGIYEKTVERIVEDSVKRFGKKNAEEKSRNTLHQIWGAYYSTRADFKKTLNKMEKNSDIKSAFAPILSIQSSTKERLEILNEFYSYIFSITGKEGSILDLGCGLNPLAFPWMDLPSDFLYTAVDIDIQQMQFLKECFELFNIGKNKRFIVGDVVTDDFGYADTIFMFKLLHPLMKSANKSVEEILGELKCKYIVVTFPMKSIGGRNKGMADFYSTQFEEVIEKNRWNAQKREFSTELVYILKTPFNLVT